MATATCRDRLTGLSGRELLEGGDVPFVDGRDSLLLVDLDHFRAVNDTYGHHCGDEVLRIVGERIQKAAAHASLLVRLSGDEFVVTLSTGDRTACERLAQQLYAAIREPIEIDDASMLFMDASIGIALADGDVSVWDLISRAGASIHDAKRSGRAPKICTFSVAEHGEILETLALSLDLRAAITCEELVLHYQPIVDMASRRAVGFEALLRWPHATLGPISPQRFIPLAEQAGLMPDLGQRVLEQALEQARAWGEMGPEAPYVSVNLSIHQLEAPDFAARFSEALRDSGVPPSRLKVEITESALASDFDAVRTPLKQIRALGVGVLLDDFGTGYSSLGYVRELPLDGVKLDRIFTRDLTVSAGAWALARSVISLVGQLGLEIIAEGLETAAHLAQLRSLGCHIGQGFYFAQPLPPAALRFEQLGRAKA